MRSGPTASGNAKIERSRLVADRGGQGRPPRRRPRPRSAGSSTGRPDRTASQHGPSPRSNCNSSRRAATPSLADRVSLPSRLPSVDTDAPVTGKRSTKGRQNPLGESADRSSASNAAPNALVITSSPPLSTLLVRSGDAKGVVAARLPGSARVRRAMSRGRAYRGRHDEPGADHDRARRARRAVPALRVDVRSRRHVHRLGRARRRLHGDGCRRRRRSPSTSPSSTAASADSSGASSCATS